MSYLFDTNVLSELVRSKPDNKVLSWVASLPADSLYVSVLTLGEIRHGIEKISDAIRKEKLRVWLEHELPDWFDGRVLSIDARVADRWGRLRHQAGRPVPGIDTLLAATALIHGLRIVTRNTQDFQYPDLEVINPWISQEISV
jgi:toxin FitB